MKMEIKIAFITHQIGKTPKKKKRLLFGKATGNSRMMGIKIRTISMKEILTVTKKIAYLLTLWPRNPIPGIPIQDPHGV